MYRSYAVALCALLLLAFSYGCREPSSTMAPAPDHAVRDGATLQVWADGVLVADLDDAAVIEVFLASLPADSRRQLVAAGELATDEPRLVAAHRAGLLSLGDKAVADRTGISMSWGRIKDRYRDR